MSRERVFEQQEVDEEILHYVREMQETAPITIESVTRYLQRVRRRSIDERSVLDRVDDLRGEGKLDVANEWVAGTGVCRRIRITPKGRDVLDLVIPPNA